ncbi:MAG: hypothetical protein MUC62_02475 [Candidatus Thermoplasmatota archaeon]|nr:hypothetical protein [Candidatus Thermoplasmatota archaeon]
MDEAGVVYTYCDSCAEETPHKVIRGRMRPPPNTGFEGSVQCITCRSIHSTHIPLERPLSIQAIISDGQGSTRTRMEVPPDEVLSVEEELFHEGHNLFITSLESKGRRVLSSASKDIDCIWFKVFDKVKVKVAIVKGAITKSYTLEASPDEEFCVGDILEVGGGNVMIDKIKVERGTIYSSDRPVEARDIKRVFTKQIRDRS